MNTNGREWNEDILIYKELSYKIIGLAMRVHSGLGHGFLDWKKSMREH
jgi:hypothetical protein